ncbi:MAG TPA: bifunctional UDP-3-O-[3-hydroxymyristoyl] N-acetylglucosamine deacetylase/3-hydroxyacyl-ACP dehydratase [Flavobacteriales bacterium]|nr:bifunctional UDP-3-O-[3-hydroxymyristoyl] N-acetylglucosamine deacetylase/3-hydroxyacyl-ACP dehydratase [Flavobacteriales bacterium]
MQKTIKNSVSVSGVGIHTGVTTNMTLKPAEANTGITFIRIDLLDKTVIKADVDNVFSTERSTGLKNEKAEINTVEHILAAVVGFEIDNLIIEVDNIEIPILDGSSKKFTELIEQTGTTELNVKKDFFEIKRTITFTDKESGTILTATPSNKYAVKVEIDYNSEILRIQKAAINSIKEFNSEITSSRTFCFLHELEVLLANNLIKGGDVNNAIVIVEEEITEEKLNKLATAFNKSDIKVGEGGILNNLKLRHKNEPARHKLLDVIGDLALVGKPIKGRITAYKPGHKSNIEFAKQLKKIMKKTMNKIAPEINFNKAPLYDKAKIKTILPHREPFLFIDEIRELGEDYIIGTKFVTSDEDYFKGHFPKEPVMPGVLQLETMAQAGGFLILSTVDSPEDYLPFFMKIDNAKFKKKVVPGDTIIFRLNLISPIRRGLCHMHGKGFVDGNIVVEGDLLAQIMPKK